MFTGLVKTQGKIRRVDQRGDCIMTIAMRDPFPVEIGDSIACHGICLTATKVTGNEFKVSLSAETMARTNAGSWEMGTLINLEPSLRVGDPMGGHFVSGHVDGMARALSAEPSGDSMVWVFEVPATLGRFIAAKGSITIDGVSLTVNGVGDSREITATDTNPNPSSDPRSPQGEPLAPGVSEAKGTRSPSTKTIFTVNIIPHTASVTCFDSLHVGTLVNIEIDMLARYVARLQEVGR